MQQYSRIDTSPPSYFSIVFALIPLQLYQPMITNNVIHMFAPHKRPRRSLVLCSHKHHFRRLTTGISIMSKARMCYT